jgi:hypothetical protein
VAIFSTEDQEVFNRRSGDQEEIFLFRISTSAAGFHRWDLPHPRAGPIAEFSTPAMRFGGIPRHFDRLGSCFSMSMNMTDD